MLWIVALTVFAVLCVSVSLLAKKEVLLAAHREGRREGLKRAAEIARERGNLAVEIAPEGRLAVGVVRGQMAHAIELEILGELSR